MIVNPRVITRVVENDLCIGCGICTYKCPSHALTMVWNTDGFLVPELSGNCDNDATCITVCPFNPEPIEAVKDETALSEVFLTDGTQPSEKLGRLKSIYVGYAKEFRSGSSSGGMATYILDKLLDKGVVKHILSVRSTDEAGFHYQYKVSSSKSDLRSSSKTRYYPVTLATVMPKIDKLTGPVAVVGVACFVKAIRLAQYHDPTLKDKIPFIVGIICGGLKSSFFTEYLADKAGVLPVNAKNPEYRIKDINSTANDYAFSCTEASNGKNSLLKMREVGDMWGTGLFKANACDYCDDVTTELADVSVGDAWMEPYKQDGYGTSVIITRSPLAETIIQEGKACAELRVESLSPEEMRASQQGSFNHRHEGMYVRLKEAKRKRVLVSEKRYGKRSVALDVNAVQKLRRIARRKSLTIWSKYPNAVIFDRKMTKLLFCLRLVTRATQYRRRVTKRVLGAPK